MSSVIICVSGWECRVENKREKEPLRKLGDYSYKDFMVRFSKKKEKKKDFMVHLGFLGFNKDIGDNKIIL